MFENTPLANKADGNYLLLTGGCWETFLSALVGAKHMKFDKIYEQIQLSLEIGRVLTQGGDLDLITFIYITSLQKDF